MVLSNAWPVLWLDTLATRKCGICVSNLSFTCCRLEYIKLGSPSDPTWSEFPQTLTQTQGARRYVTLFESPFVDSGLSEVENNALRASSLLAVPPPPPDMQPLEGFQGTNLTEANLTQWASCVQDVALGMWRPPRTAMDCPNQDIAGILYRLENLTGVGFCHLCYALVQGPSSITACNSVEFVSFCYFFVCIKLLGNVVRVYPKIVQGLTFLSV